MFFLLFLTLDVHGYEDGRLCWKLVQERRKSKNSKKGWQQRNQNKKKIACLQKKEIKITCVAMWIIDHRWDLHQADQHRSWQSNNFQKADKI